ncbi:unnamed protein product [marine sediment metagenome]|uniref:Uncharacterized protein n=1 Tax=marine sediment metagenome TaxID=412755 RepID=X1DXL2_9ZZZZ
MNREDRQQNLSRLVNSCCCAEELDQFATDFNNIYKVVRDHWQRVEDIEKRKGE